MKKLEDLVDKQRDEIRAKDHELTLRNDDVEAVSFTSACLTISVPREDIQAYNVLSLTRSHETKN